MVARLHDSSVFTSEHVPSERELRLFKLYQNIIISNMKRQVQNAISLHDLKVFCCTVKFVYCHSGVTLLAVIVYMSSF